MTMANPYAQRSQYQRDAILSASPARLLTMLYDRLLLDLGRAEAAQVEGRWDAASEQLLHAQAIVNELSSSLRMDVWDGAENLQAIYAYTRTAMVNANITRDAGPTRECIELLEPLRQAWHEAAGTLQAPPAAPAQGAARPAGVLGVG